MKQHLLEPVTSIAALAYELKFVALAFAAEAERLARREDLATNDPSKGGDVMATRLHWLINQVHEATLALRFARHRG